MTEDVKRRPLAGDSSARRSGAVDAGNEWPSDLNDSAQWNDEGKEQKMSNAVTSAFTGISFIVRQENEYYQDSANPFHRTWRAVHPRRRSRRNDVYELSN